MKEDLPLRRRRIGALPPDGRFPAVDLIAVEGRGPRLRPSRDLTAEIKWGAGGKSRPLFETGKIRKKNFTTLIYLPFYRAAMARSTLTLILALALASVMILSAGSVLATPTSSANPSTPPSLTISKTPAAPSAPSPSSISSPSSVMPAGKVFGINTVLANSVEQKEQALLSSGGSLAGFHPPNLHQAPPLKDTHNLVTPLYNAAPAPMGVAYYGLSNTTGTIQGTTVNTTSLLGTWNTTDPLGTAAEVFDTSSGNAAGSFGAQLNTVLVNTTLHGQTSFGPAGNVNVGPTGCQAWNLAENNLNSTTCPNVFWLQLYIQYSEASHSLTISNEIWNFSNPTGDWSGTGTNTIDGFGSVESAEVYQGPSSGTITIPYPYTFSLALYMNYTQGPCHTDSVAGTGIASCPAAYGTTYPLNELFMNYTVRSGSGARLCPTSIPSGRLCGEDDDVFFNSLAPGATHGVPALGPHGRIGSATIQANGTQYDPIGLTNDFEFDYGIGSDDGATNLIFYQHGIVGLDYCQNANAVQAPTGGIKCGTYSPPPAAEDFGGETGETSTGEMAYWAPQGAAAINPHTGLGPTLLPGASSPITYLDTGPALLTGLWNMTGSTYTGSAPYPAFTGGEPLSYANIAPANAWVGIAQDI